MSSSKLSVTVYPADRDFQINAGSVTLGSREYANSSNAYRGARSAIRNMLKNRFVTNESNYGSDTVAITNANGFVIAANQYSRPASAKQATQRVLSNTAGVKPKALQLEVVR